MGYGDRLNAAYGTFGERLAAAHYRARGYAVLERNWRCRAGEIDLICARGTTLVVCEVKARARRDLGHPLEAVTGAKQRRLRHLAALYLRQQDLGSVPMETLIVERKDGVVTVTMNRPERKNAANGKMLIELRAIFEEIEDDPDDRVMVLTGAGGAFCSGADLSDPSGPATDPSRSGLARMRRLGDVALALHHISKPTIAKVDGFAVGAGLSLALGCDLVVCSDRAKLSMIFAKRSLSLGNGASWTLAAGPPLALSMTKTLLHASSMASMEQAVEDEARCQALNFSTHDTQEALAAFSEKREPLYTGR